MAQVATSLAEVLDNDYVKIALDRSQSLEPVIARVAHVWEADPLTRRPAMIYRVNEDGTYTRESTLDAMTALLGLAARDAVINLPTYALLRPARTQSNQTVVSRTNRHGQLRAVVSNKESHAFSVRITDYNVIEQQPDGSEKVGAYRNFNIVNDDGVWHSGWDTFEFNPKIEEREFYEEKGILNEVQSHGLKNSIGPLANFVHPNLWIAFYGSRYLITKICAARAADEAKHYRDRAKFMREKLGVMLPGNGGKKAAVVTEVVGTPETTYANVLEAEVSGLKFDGERYPFIGRDEQGYLHDYGMAMPSDSIDRQNVLRYAEERARQMTWKIGPRFRAPCRAVELAFRNFGFMDDERKPGNEFLPGWDVPEWQRDTKDKGKRKKWNSLELVPKDNNPSGLPLQLRYRIIPKKVTVNGETASEDQA